MSINFCISLTTIPSRIKTIAKTINSLNDQEIQPKKIFLNIPYYYKRLDQKIDEETIKKIKFVSGLKISILQIIKISGPKIGLKFKF